MKDEKTREGKLRRELDKLGYSLKKSRSRNPDLLGYGGYMVVDAQTDCVVAGADGGAFSLSLDDAENFLRE